MQVDEQLAEWPEQAERATEWFSPQEAAAPVPNPDLGTPIPPDRVSVVPTLLHGPRDFTNDGFLPGSKFQNRGEDIPSTRGPGFQLQMPIP